VYFCNEFLSILDSCRNLPEEIISKTMEYEKADKMNPPIEKRKKEIRLDLLKQEGKRLQHGCEGQDIDIDSVSGMIEKIPLDRDEISDTGEPYQEEKDHQS